MSKPLTHQQKRWNRHWNYRLAEYPMALAIWEAAKGKLTPREAIKCADAGREALLTQAMQMAIAERQTIISEIGERFGGQ